MKNIDPIANAAAAVTGPNSARVEEQAQVWGGAHEVLTSRHSAQDAKLSFGGGSPVVVSERGDERPFPTNIAAVNGDVMTAEEPSTFGNPVTPAPFDGFGDRGSGVDKITGRH